MALPLYKTLWNLAFQELIIKNPKARCKCGHFLSAHPEKERHDTGRRVWLVLPCSVAICKCHNRSFTLGDDTDRPFTGSVKSSEWS